LKRPSGSRAWATVAAARAENANTEETMVLSASALGHTISLHPHM
jgi:hypothetical protein